MSDVNKKELTKHSCAALTGVAVGDALGKMTEGFWPPEIYSRYGGRVETFLSPQQLHSSHVWAYAEVTDDFKMKAEIKEKATHSGNGAPMRVAPIGILHSPTHLKELINDVEQACSCTHNTRSALSAACAIAAAYSAALEGFDIKSIIEASIEAAFLGNQLGMDDFCPDVARRLQWMSKNVEKEQKGLRNWMNPGFRAWEGATFALALVMKYDSAKDAILAAVNEGGDADSIASMAGGIVAARNPDTLPAEWVEIVKRENNLEFMSLAERLMVLRKLDT
jgi:ADP-ribosylglycohydrolase